MSNDDKDMDDWEAAMAEQAAAEDEESDKKKKRLITLVWMVLKPQSWKS